MTTAMGPAQPLEDPMAELERQLFHAFLAGAGEDLHALLARDDEAAHRLLADASTYASAKLSEIEARLHYVRQLHGLMSCSTAIVSRI